MKPSKSASRGSIRMRLKKSKKTYFKWFERADDAGCLTLIWSVHALQSKRAAAAQRFIKFPKEAITDGIHGELAVYPWELETFVTSLLNTRKDRPRQGKHHVTVVDDFSSIITPTNALRDIENSEYFLCSKPEDILEEMYRIGQRQFSWQRGANTEQIYRYAFVYGQGDCGEYFQQTNGLSVSDFLCLSVMLLGLFLGKPWIDAPDPSILGLSKEDMEKTLELHSIRLATARKEAEQLNLSAARRLGRPLRIAYMPSLLRRKPIIRINHKFPVYISPLPSFILDRATLGLYYDIRNGPQKLLNEANARFEEYVQSLLTAYLPSLKAVKDGAYGRKGFQVDPPDCLVEHDEQVVLVIECKTTKLTFEAQYAENPMEAATQGFEQISKGIFQIWRFFSHVRRGIYNTRSVSQKAISIVLTMDGWMQMAAELRKAAIERAREMANEYEDITEADMKPIVFASTEELNGTLAQTELDEFLTVLSNATAEKYEGYGLPEVARDCGVRLVRKQYPLETGEILPWWDKIKDREYAREN